MMQNENFNSEKTRVFFVNELSPPCEFTKRIGIVPFGDFQTEALLPTPGGLLKKQKAIQRVTKESAMEMVLEFDNSLPWRGRGGFMGGFPIYLGHPNVSGFENLYTDKEPKGFFSRMDCYPDKVVVAPFFTNAGLDYLEGRKLVNGEKVRGLSVEFSESKLLGEENGLPVFCPTKIASIGLTSHPTLPVEFFNSDDVLQVTLNHEQRREFVNSAMKEVAEREKLDLVRDRRIIESIARREKPALFVSRSVKIVYPPRQR